MAAFQISPPENFSFTRPEEWPLWIKRFECYRQASGLSEKVELSQVNALAYAMGYQTEDILTLFCLSEADGKKYGVIKDKFENHFVKCRNKIQYMSEQGLIRGDNYPKSQQTISLHRSIV